MNQSLEKPSSSSWIWLTLAVTIILTGAIRLRLLDVPLDRDEGGYALMGQMLLHGIAPYKEAYDNKMPGLYACYALIIAVFGKTPAGIHTGLLLVNAATILLLFLIGRCLISPLTGLTAAAFFALLSFSQGFLGFIANAEPFVLFAVLGGIYLLFIAMEKNRLALFLLSGFILGIALLIKQIGVFFVFFAWIYLVFVELNKQPSSVKSTLRKQAALLLGAVLPLAAACLLLYFTSALSNFLFFAFSQPLDLISVVPILTGLKDLPARLPAMVGPCLPILTLSALGLILLLFEPEAKKKSSFLILFLTFSIFSVCPGFYFREHYFLLLHPVIALLGGLTVDTVWRLLAPTTLPLQLAKVLPAALAVLALAYGIFSQKTYLFDLSPASISRQTYGCNAFPESLLIADYIRNNSAPNDTIAVLGSEPQIYLYANRRPATRYLYAYLFTYPLLAYRLYAFTMQNEIISEIQAARPEILVFAGGLPSWHVRPDLVRPLYGWYEKYTKKYFEKVGVIDILSEKQTVYVWGKPCKNYKARSLCAVTVFKRKH